MQTNFLMRGLFIAAACTALSLSNIAFAELETLQNDSFVSGGLASFQAGFVSDEVAAARFVPQIPCPCIIDSITLLFGGAIVTENMGLMVWDDAAGADTPGLLLFSGNVTLTGSNIALQEIDLSLSPVIVQGPFRIGVEFAHNGLPSVATDEDGNIDASANFIFADLGGFFFWFRASALGVGGDFIIRANIDNLIAPDADQDGVADEIDNCSLVSNLDQRDTNGDGIGNACDADLDNDCSVNFIDLGIMKSVFFTGDPDADFDGDGTVNFIDLGTMKSVFFNPPGPSGVPNVCDGNQEF